MVPLSLFRDRTFAAGSAVGLLINLGFYGQLFVATLYFQDLREYSALATGLALLPETAMASVGSILSGVNHGQDRATAADGRRAGS
jgi:DHA2 family methylenomycin A resistance protein-like MFS transporter